METEVLIVGAGPVGLLLANVLGREGIDTLLLEKRRERSGPGRAIGITATSLAILADVGLEESFLAEGLPVRRVVIHGGRGLLGRAEVPAAAASPPFVITLPQERTERILLGALSSLPTVRLLPGAELRSVEPGRDGVTARAVLQGAKRSLEARGRLLCACDGASSSVRRLLGQARWERSYRSWFLMGDYADHSGLGEEVHLFFTLEGSVESFPVAGNIRRWVALADPRGCRPEELESLVYRRTGVRLQRGHLLWGSDFHPERTENHRYAVGRVLFCGDAAHTMPPIGGHGMNNGFADAHLLGQLLRRHLREGAEFPPLFAAYQRYRRRAFRSAARRSRLFMGLGTVRAPGLRQLRDLLIRFLLLPPLRSVLMRHFAMLNIPYSTTAQVYRRAALFPAPSQPGESRPR
jgi:2-polyprenyl-6-methoxyphenol hydroxylase-like FAD-dependent oxidoreductase